MYTTDRNDPVEPHGDNIMNQYPVTNILKWSTSRHCQIQIPRRVPRAGAGAIAVPRLAEVLVIHRVRWLKVLPEFLAARSQEATVLTVSKISGLLAR